MLTLGYLAGTVDLFQFPRAQAQPADSKLSENTEEAIRTVHKALNDAAEALRQDGSYETITEGTNAFLILSGGGSARRDLESGNGVDPETFAALYAGRVIPELSDQISENDQGQLTYNGKTIMMYSKSRLRRMYSERLRIRDGGL